MDNRIPVIVKMRVDCTDCRHLEDETYEFDMPPDNADPMEACEPGKCPRCNKPVQIYLRRTQQVQ